MKEQEAIKLLKEKGYKIEKPNTIIIDNTEYELFQHNNGELLKDIEIPAGYRLLKPWEACRLWDLGYLRNNWYLVENTNLENKKKGLVAWFRAGSVGLVLYTGWDSDDADSSLGVVLCRDLGGKKK